ncbi:MAG: hypothetical protein M0R02_09165 [Bacteroidales bacterium]|nr:hypothetical protein [Bacteroidales bacterium]
METITLRINPRSKAGKVFSDLVQLFSKLPGVEIVQEKSTYNNEFVKKVLYADKNDKRIRIKTKSIWDSI